MEHTLKLKIITMDGIFFSGEAVEVILPTENGQIAVLAHHIPIVATLKEGSMTVKFPAHAGGDTEKKYTISSGVLEVRPESEVYVLVDHAVEG